MWHANGHQRRKSPIFFTSPSKTSSEHITGRLGGSDGLIGPREVAGSMPESSYGIVLWFDSGGDQSGLDYRKPHQATHFFLLSSLPNLLTHRYREVLLLAQEIQEYFKPPAKEAPYYPFISSPRHIKSFICSNVQFYTYIYLYEVVWPIRVSSMERQLL